MVAVGRVPLVLAVALLCPSPAALAVRWRARGLKCLVKEFGLNPFLTEFQQPPPPGCETWGEQLGRLIGTGARPLSPDVWSGGLEKQFSLSLEDIHRALRPASHEGSHLRLRLASWRLARGEPLTITVLGGSMPSGVDSSTPYSRFIEDHFRELGFNVKVHNLAVTATTSEYPIEHTIPHNRKIQQSDVIIVDYSINDAWAEQDGLLSREVREGFSRLVQVLLELPSHPAVVEFATMGNRFYAMDRYGKNKTNHNTAVWGCTEKLADLVHADAIGRFDLPVVSFPDAVCHATTPFWFAHKLWAHPNATTHDLIARLFLGVFALEAQAACNGELGPDHPRAHSKLEEHTRCFVNSRNLDLDFDGCREDETICRKYTAAHDPAWNFGPDLPKKPPGWFAEATAPRGSEIVFRANISEGGWIRLDYLATYENIGSAQCWLSGTDPDTGCVLDGLLSARFSTRRSAYMAAVGFPAGPVDVHCRTLRGKFKLLGVASCR